MLRKCSYLFPCEECRRLIGEFGRAKDDYMRAVETMRLVKGTKDFLLVQDIARNRYKRAEEARLRLQAHFIECNK